VLARGLCEGEPLAIIAEKANRYAAFVAGRTGATPRPPGPLLASITARPR